MHACAVLAALSPKKSWKENKRLAWNFIVNGVHTGHTKVNIEKAKACLDVIDDTKVLEILNGEKTKAFYLNMLYPHRNTGVTIDRHAVEIALGKVIPDHSMTVRQYQFFERCYIMAANKIDLLPHQLQAVTWEYWREYKKTI